MLQVLEQLKYNYVNNIFKKVIFYPKKPINSQLIGWFVCIFNEKSFFYSQN